MADGSIKIIVGASADRSVEAAFGTVEKRAELAARNVSRAFGAGGGAGAIGKSFELAGKSAETGAKQAENAWKREFSTLNKIAREQDRLWERSAKERTRSEEKAARDHERIERERTRETARYLQQQENEQERAERKANAASQRFASRASHRAVRFLFPNPIGAFGMASRIGGDILRGAGVDFSVAGSVGRSVAINSAAAQLSNRGLIEGDKGPNGQRVATAVLEAEARKTAGALSMKAEDVLAGQNEFVGLTGNLALARKLSPNISSLAGAFGASTEDTARAAGELANHLVGMSDEQKEKAIPTMLRNMGQMNAIGATDMSETARYVARVAAPAAAYGGDIQDNMMKLTALAEIAKKEGGATTASEAFGSIPNFTNTFQKAARIKGFHRLGVTDDDLFNMRTERDGKGVEHKIRTSLKDPFEIIGTVMRKTKGDFVSFFQAFPDMRGSKAVKGLQTIYNRAGGGAAGESAVNEELKKFMDASMSEDMERKKNAERMATDAAKAQEFQNALDGVIAQAKGELLPALKDLAPMALKGAEGLSHLVSWAASNPWTAVSVAVGGAIARSLAETAFRSAIEKAIMGATGGGLTLAGAATISVATASIALAAWQWDKFTKEDKATGSKDPVGDFFDILFNGKEGAAAVANVSRAMTPEEYDKAREKPAFRADRFNPNKPGYAGEPFRVDRSDAEGNPRTAEQMDPRLMAMHFANELRGRNLNVTVMNPKEIGANGPAVSPNGRGAPPGLPPRWNPW